MSDVRDYRIYNEEMAKSLIDKMFFMDKIPGVKCVIDFGCADGSLLRFIAPHFRNMTFIGYDSDEVMIKKAKSYKAAPFLTDQYNIKYFYRNELNEMLRYISRFAPDEVAINFSSVLHEVFSFNEISALQILINNIKPKYITIRDMYWYWNSGLKYPYLRVQEINNIIDTGHIDEKYIEDFEDKHGTIMSWKGLTHFLMKYQWVDNGWHEELDEDYYSWNLKMFQDALNVHYIPIFENHYQLPYLMDKWEKEFGFFEPDANTHAQFILRRI